MEHKNFLLPGFFLVEALKIACFCCNIMDALFQVLFRRMFFETRCENSYFLINHIFKQRINSIFIETVKIDFVPAIFARGQFG